MMPPDLLGKKCILQKFRPFSVIGCPSDFLDSNIKNIVLICRLQVVTLVDIPCHVPIQVNCTVATLPSNADWKSK